MSKDTTKPLAQIIIDVTDPEAPEVVESSRKVLVTFVRRQPGIDIDSLEACEGANYSFVGQQNLFGIDKKDTLPRITEFLYALTHQAPTEAGMGPALETCDGNCDCHPFDEEEEDDGVWAVIVRGLPTFVIKAEEVYDIEDEDGDVIGYSFEDEDGDEIAYFAAADTSAIIQMGCIL